MSEKELKALIKAIVITIDYDGVIPSERAYGDDISYVESSIDADVEEIFENFKELLRITDEDS